MVILDIIKCFQKLNAKMICVAFFTYQCRVNINKKMRDRPSRLKVFASLVVNVNVPDSLLDIRLNFLRRTKTLT